MIAWLSATHVAAAQPAPTAPATDAPPTVADAPPSAPPPSAAPPQAAPPQAATPVSANAPIPPVGASANPAVAVAPAPAPDRYPLAITDRPIVLPPGMTSLAFSSGVITRMRTIDDELGMPSRERQALVTLSLTVTHAFGPVEVTAGVDEWTYGGAIGITAWSIPASFYLSAWFTPPVSDGQHYYAQNASISYKKLIRPRLFALYANAFLSLYELSVDNDRMVRVTGNALAASGTILGEIQLARRLGVYVGVNGWGPLVEPTGLDGHSVLGVCVSWLFALRKWDFSIDGNLGNITREPWTSVSVGFRKRWGL